MQDLAAYLYADDGLFALSQLERLHQAFGVLTGLLDRFILRKNTRKMVIMDCQPYHVHVRMSVGVHARLMTGSGPTFWERQRMRVQCMECGVEVMVGSLMMHHQSQKVVGRGSQHHPPPTPPWGRPILTRYRFQNGYCGSGAY